MKSNAQLNPELLHNNFYLPLVSAPHYTRNNCQLKIFYGLLYYE